MKYICAAILMFSSFVYYGQAVLKVKYSETTFFDVQGQQLPPQMAANMPKSRVAKKILFATPANSLYIVNKEDKEPEPAEASGRGGFMMRRGNQNGQTYCDYDNLKIIMFTDLFGKEFLIEEDKEYQWKLHSSEQRDILGHTCVKATTMQDTLLVTAWYAPDLAVAAGPDGFSGLPGIILALSVGENRTILATTIEENFASPPPIVAPTKGEKVTREEYTKIRDEKMKEMRQMWGNGHGAGGPGRGNTIIIRN